MSATITLDELTLLTDDASDRAADEAQGFHFEVSADGTEWKNAEAVITEIQSQLFDGQAIALGSYSNMEVPLMVRVVAQDSALLAAGCALLIKVIRRPGMRELTYIAPDGASPATVFDVLHVTPSMQVDFGNLDENHSIRTYSLRMLCKPFPRSATEVRAAATAVGSPAYTDIDTLSSSTAWTPQAPAWTAPVAQSWAPLRYAIMTNPLTSDTYKTRGWSPGSDAISIGWEPESGTTGHMLVTGKPTSSSTRVYANAPWGRLVGTGAVRLRLEMGSRFLCTFGVLYRWFNAAGNQIGTSLAIPEVPRTADTHTLTAMLTPVAGAVSVAIYPYARFTNSTGGVRTWTTKKVFVGADGASFFGDTPDTATNAYDWVGAPWQSQQVELGHASKTSASGSVSVTAYYHPDSQLSPIFTRTASWTTTSAEPYLVVSGQVTGGPTSVQIYGIPGRSFVNPDLTVAAPDGTFKAYYRIGDMTQANLYVRVTPTGSGSGKTATLEVTRLERATSIPAIGTGRQGRFSLDVEGTMPAEASLQVANEGGVGGNVLIYTAPTNPDFIPALSPSLVAAGTADGATISNRKFTVATSKPSAETWEVPHVGLVDSTYALFAKVSATGLTTGAAYTFSVAQHSSGDSGAGYYGDELTTTGKIIASATTYSGFAHLSTMRLPTVDLGGTAEGLEGLKLWVTGGGTWTLDEAWLFDLVNGSLSHVAVPASSNYPNVTIKAATPDHPQQRYLTEYDDGSIRSFAYAWSALIWGNHRLDPATGCDVFAICDAPTPDLSVSASYYPRWDVFAAPVAADGNT